jgi:hypothetical protein
MSPSAQSSRRLLARLHQDLSELNNDPYPGVAVFTDDADLRKLCLVLIPPSGPWKDMALHFNVSLPGNWVRILMSPFPPSTMLIQWNVANFPTSRYEQCLRDKPSKFVGFIYLLRLAAATPSSTRIYRGVNEKSSSALECPLMLIIVVILLR